MISIFIQPSKILFLKAHFKSNKKNKQLIVDKSEVYPHQENISGTQQTFADISAAYFEIFDIIGGDIDEGVNIVLPDFLFLTADCIKYNNQADIPALVQKITQKKPEEVYYSVPLTICPAPQEKQASVYIVEKNYIDAILTAAEEKKIHILSIEPASIGFLRCIDNLQTELFLFEGYEDNATFIGYSEIAGIFKLDTPEITAEKMENLSNEEANRLTSEALAAFESAADLTFEFLDPGVPITFIGTTTKKYLARETFAKRLNPKEYHFPEFVSFTLETGKEEKWMPAVGTLLQYLDINPQNEQFSDFISDNKVLLSGNILPANIVKKANRYQQLKQAEKYSVHLAVILAFAIVAELTAVFTFNLTSNVPDNLVQEYNQRKSQSENLTKSLSVVKLYEKENERPVEVLEKLTAIKPAQLYFTSLKIQSAPPPVKPKKDKGNKQNKEVQPATTHNPKWLTLKTVSNNPLVFQDYLMELSKSEYFKDVTITQISSDSSGYKSANFLIGKGDVKTD